MPIDESVNAGDLNQGIPADSAQTSQNTDTSLSGAALAGAGGGDTPAPAGGGSPAFSVRDSLARSGYDTSSFQGDEDAFQALVRTAEEFHKNQNLIEQGRAYSQYAPQFQQWLQQQQAQQQVPQQPQQQVAAPAEQKPAGFDWKAPEYDVRWERFCERDQYGRWKPIDNDPALMAYAQKLNSYYDWHLDSGRRIVSEFPTLVDQVVGGRFDSFEKQIQDMVSQRVQEAIAKYESDNQARSYIDQQKADLYQLDSSGRMLIDPATGEPALTAKGKAFVEYGMEAQKLGLSTQESIRTYIERMLAADTALGKFGAPAGTPAGNGTPLAQNGAAAVPAASAAETGAKKRGEFLRKVTQDARAPGRGGSIPTSNERRVVQNPDATIHEIFEQEAEAAGIRPMTG